MFVYKKYLTCQSNRILTVSHLKNFGKDLTIKGAEITYKIYLKTLSWAIYVYKHCVI